MQNRHPLERELFIIAGFPQNGDTSSIKRCIKQIKESKDIPKPNIDLQNEEGNTALMIAATTISNRSIAKILIEERANPDIQNNFNCGHVLIGATREGWLDIVELLINVKADINNRNYLGTTGLICAAYNGHIDIVTALIKAGCDLEIEYIDGTALDGSMKSSHHNRHLPIIRILLEAGACINHPKSLFEFLEEKHNQKKLENAEDIYVCLSILCEQQERIREEKAAPEKSRLSEELYQKAENMLRDLPIPYGVTYKLRRDAVIEKIDTVTNQLFPLRYPKGVNQIMAEYDNPFLHQLFDIQKNPKETVLKENATHKKRKLSSI